MGAASPIAHPRPGLLKVLDSSVAVWGVLGATLGLW